MIVRMFKLSVIALVYVNVMFSLQIMARGVTFTSLPAWTSTVSG